MPSFQGKTILIIDDSAEMRFLAKKILENDGATVIDVESVDLALSIVEKNAPHLILVDLNMPGKSGFDFLNLRKNYEKIKTVPTLVISGRNDAPSVSMAIGLGASDYILKPFRTTLLLQKTRKALKLVSFLSKKFENNRIPATISVSAEMVEISPIGYKIESPIKLSPQEDVEVHSEYLKNNISFKGVHTRTSDKPAKFLKDSRYLSEINFIGVGDSFSQSIRKLLRDWK